MNFGLKEDRMCMNVEDNWKQRRPHIWEYKNARSPNFDMRVGCYL